jgi:hypothetical protein
VFPRGLERAATLPDFDAAMAEAALAREEELGYVTASGRYWEELHRFDAAEIDALDAMWLATL